MNRPATQPTALFFPGDDHAVLMLHGLSSSPLELRFLARYLNAEGFTTCAPVLPGYSAGSEEEAMEAGLGGGRAGGRRVGRALCPRLDLRAIDRRGPGAGTGASPSRGAVACIAVTDALIRRL